MTRTPFWEKNKQFYYFKMYRFLPKSSQCLKVRTGCSTQADLRFIQFRKLNLLVSTIVKFKSSKTNLTNVRFEKKKTNASSLSEIRFFFNQAKFHNTHSSKSHV